MPVPLSSKDDQKRQKKKERAERRRLERVARERSKTTRKVIVVLILAATIGGIGYLAYSAATSGPKIGPLNSAHEHADWAIYINGQRMILNGSKYQHKSDYVHMESGTDTIHLHAINIQLSYLLGTLGMKITPTSLNVEGVTYNNEGDKKVRVFVNGKENTGFDKYIMKSLDKILVLYGNEDDSQIQAYIKTIPDEAKKIDQPQPPGRR